MTREDDVLLGYEVLQPTAGCCECETLATKGVVASIVLALTLPCFACVPCCMQVRLTPGSDPAARDTMLIIMCVTGLSRGSTAPSVWRKGQQQEGHLPASLAGSRRQQLSRGHRRPHAARQQMSCRTQTWGL